MMNDESVIGWAIEAVAERGPQDYCGEQDWEPIDEASDGYECE